MEYSISLTRDELLASTSALVLTQMLLSQKGEGFENEEDKRTHVERVADLMRSIAKFGVAVDQANTDHYAAQTTQH